jgi:hypothetical protein
MFLCSHGWLVCLRTARDHRASEQGASEWGEMTHGRWWLMPPLKDQQPENSLRLGIALYLVDAIQLF